MAKKEKDKVEVSYSIDENSTTGGWAPASEQFTVSYATCLLYTSDAADE